MGRSKLWRGLTAIFASLFAISIVLSAMADSRAGFLNGRLGTSNYITVQDGESTVDGYYFDSEFTTLEEVVKAKQALAEQIGSEGAVLLKNNGALPLDKATESVTLWGFNSSSPILGGMMGSTAVAAEAAGQKGYGIKEALAERGFTVNQDMIDFYADSSMDQYRMQSMLFGQVSYGHALGVAFDTVYDAPDTYFVGEAPVSLYSDSLTASADGTVAVVVISRDSSEAADYQPGMKCSSPDDSFERPLALSENERAVIELAKQHSTKLIVLINADSAMEIEELKQDADINNLIPGTAEYVTRADWTKGWETISELTATDDMAVRLNNQASALTPNGQPLQWGVDSGLSLIGMVKTDADGNFAGVPDITDPAWDQLVDQITLDEAMHLIQEGSDDFDAMESAGFPTTNCNDGPVGFAYDQVSSYTAHWAPSESTAPTYVSAEDPYANYSMAVFPTEPVVAATFNQELVEREGELYGEDSLWSNTPGTLSPAINLHRTPYCARNHEYYSEDPMLTNLMAVAVCKGAVKKGLMMEVKHFAFNHQEMNRVGVSTFMTEQGGREGDLRAFQGACAGNWTKGVMSAYNRVGDVYTGGSRALQMDILRREWGYTGWIVTDMAVPPEYMNWREAVYGGGCAVLTSTNTFAQGQIGTMESHRDEILADEAFQRNMKDGIKYYLYTFAGSNAMNGITANTRRVYVRTWWQNAIRYTEIGLGVLTALCAILLFVTKRERGKA